MYNFLDLSFLFNFVYFWIAVFFAFYIPGSLFFSRLKLTLFQNVVLGTIFGMVLWGWQAYVFGYLNVRFLSYIYLLVFFIFWIKANKEKIKSLSIKTIKPLKIDKFILLFIILGSLGQLTSVFFTGVMTSDGLIFCCSNVSDNILNISITNQVIDRFPPFEPGYFGKEIVNYHYWSSIVIGELIRVFRLPLIETNYQYTTVFISLFLGFISLVFVQLLGLGKTFARWLILLLYFGSDLIWLFVAIFRGNQIFDMYPLESGQQFLENIPRAMAVIVVFAGLSLFLLLIKKRDKVIGAAMALTFASLVGFKVYIGFFVFPGIFLLGFYYGWKKDRLIFLSIFFTFLLAGAVYFPVNLDAGGLYFTGFWRFENFVVQPYLGDLNRMELARTIFQNDGKWIRVIQFELTYILVFIVAIFGTKIIGFIQSKKSLSKLPWQLHVILLIGIGSSFVLGSFFGQTSGGSNTFNFLVSIFILGSIYTALSLSHFLSNKPKVIVAGALLLVLSLIFVRNISLVYRNIAHIASYTGFKVSNEELEGIKSLRSIDTNSLVLVDPNNLRDKDSPYISFLSGQKMFLSGQGNELTAHNVDFSERLKSLNVILLSPFPSSVSAELKKNNIGYLFLLKSTNLVSTRSADFLDEIFSNKKVKILKFDNE